MPKFNLSVPHSLGKAEARNRLEQFSDRIRAEYQDQVKDVQQSWEDDSLLFGFRTMGMNFDGRLTVEDDRVDVEGNLPFAAMMLKGRIESSIRNDLEKLMA